jgi:hypothetical protein
VTREVVLTDHPDAPGPDPHASSRQQATVDPVDQLVVPKASDLDRLAKRHPSLANIRDRVVPHGLPWKLRPLEPDSER